MTGPVPFDHHSPRHAADPVGSYREIREDTGIASSDCHGGFTVITRYDDIVAVARDHDRFSNALELPGGEGFGGGIALPHNPAASRMSFAEMDPPEWKPIRRMLNPIFGADAIRRTEPLIRDVTNEFIDRFVESGRCDLVFDLCSPVPAIVTLRLLGLPTDEWERWSEPVHRSMYTPRDPGHPAFAALMGSFEWIFDQIRLAIADRHRDPRPDDLISSWLHDDGDGSAMDDDLAFETVYTMLAAGIDTTTSLVSTALHHLAAHPDDRRRVLDDPESLEPAAEEVLRYYSPAQSTARTVAEDVEIAGASFQRGDRLLLAWASANRDPRLFKDPDEFVLDRAPNRHIAFGQGIHRCIGAPLARLEFVVIVGEVLRRIPDYVVDTANAPRYPDVGLQYGYERMPATFTPGPVEGGDAR
jgi:cytochrome P450